MRIGGFAVLSVCIVACGLWACSLLAPDDAFFIGGRDASVEGGAEGGGRGCAAVTNATFCDDFEDPSKPFATTYMLVVDDGGSAGVTDAQAWSPPNSAMFMTSSLLAASSQPRAYARHIITGSAATRVTSSAWVYLVAPQAGAQVYVNRISLSQSTFTRLEFKRDSGGVLSASLSEQVDGDAGPTFPAYPLGANIPEMRFFQVQRTLTLGSPLHEQVVIDGTKTEVDLQASFAGPSTSVEVWPGIIYADTGTDGWTVYVDDVVVDLQ